MFLDCEAGNVTELQIYVEDLGSGTNTNAVNIYNGIHPLFTSNKTLTVGLNTYTPDQYASFWSGEELELKVITGTGNDDVSWGYLIAKVEET